MDNKINPVIIIQARMGSTRLPEKVMREIDGIPLIGYQISRLKESGLEICVATSDHSNNERLIKYVESLGITVFVGDEMNVLKRYYDAAVLFSVRDIIRITGDNPLVDGKIIREQVDLIKPKSNRYYFSESSDKGMPLGTSFEMFSFELLEEAFLKAKTLEESEHVTPYMNQNLPKNIELITMDLRYDCKNIRLTVDTEKDFKLIEILIQNYNAHKLSVSEIVNVFKTNRKLLNINSDIKQTKIRNLLK